MRPFTIKVGKEKITVSEMAPKLWKLKFQSGREAFVQPDVVDGKPVWKQPGNFMTDTEFKAIVRALEDHIRGSGTRTKARR